MKFKSVNYFQAGGPVPSSTAAPQGTEDPTQMLLQGALQAILGQDCELAMQVCLMLVQALGGGAVSLEPAPQEAAPAPAEGEPVYRRGGRLIRRISK